MRFCLFSLIVCSLFCSPGLAQQLEREGPEHRVNTYTPATQGFSDLAAGPEGEFVIAWASFGQDGEFGYGIFGQIYNPDGTTLGGEFQVHTTTKSEQWTPSVAVDGQGQFIFVWQSFHVEENDFDIFCQRFDANGAALGAETMVNSFTTDRQRRTTVAASENGDFLIVWESDEQDFPGTSGIYGQLYDSQGSPSGTEFRVNETIAGDQNWPRVASLDDGYAVVWDSHLQTGSGEEVVLRLFDSNGAPSSGEIVVNSTTAGNQRFPDLAVSPDDRIAVVWGDSGLDGSGEGIFARILDSTGAPLSGEFQVNTHTSQNQKNPRVSSDGSTGFVAVWTSESQVDEEDIFAQRFSNNGSPMGDELQVNLVATSNDQDMPNVAGSSGKVTVIWRAHNVPGGSSRDVVAQRFRSNLFSDGFESGNTVAWSATLP